VTAEGLTYDDAADRWTALAAVPDQHTEVAATGLGELIRVSGGRRLTRSERTARLLEQMELQLEEIEATAPPRMNWQPSGQRRDRSRRIQKLGYRLKYKARYGSKRPNDFNFIPPVLDARSAPAQRFALKSKRLRRLAKVSPVQLRDVMRAASSVRLEMHRWPR
jgi:hypothetical protein